jgi:hypothetical protein
MNLLQIRTKLRELSGRFDLVNSDFTDNGADFFINAGSRYLDRIDETQKSAGQYFVLLTAGSYSCSFPYCRALKEVWVATSTERWQLKKMPLQDAMAAYMGDLPSARQSGSPSYYSPCITRYIPEDATAVELTAFSGFVDIPSGNAHEYNALLLNCPTDVQLMVDIRGLFYSMSLIADTDINYWSVNHPALLIMSAMRQIEVMNRNTQGVKDWNESIGTEVHQLGLDFIEEEIAEVDQMEG